MINTHGSPTGIAGKDDEGNWWRLTSDKIGELNHYDIGWVALYGCNAGHIDHAATNPANAFAGVVNGNVYAADGTVYARYSLFGNRYKYVAKGDSTFKQWLAPGTKRKSVGWVVYRGGNGNFSVEDFSKLVIFK